MGFVRKIGRKIDKAIIQPVLNTVEAIVEDPKKLAMVALSIMAPGAGTALGSALGLTGTAATVVGQAAINTALNGGDIKAGIIAAAIPVVGKELAGSAATAFMDSGMDKALAESAGKVVAGAGIATVQGKDPLSALISGGLSEGTAAITRDIPGFSDLPEAAKKSINAAVATELVGGDGTQSAINAAMNVGIKSLAEYTVGIKSPDTSGPNKEDFIEGYFKPGGEGYIAPEPTPIPEPEPAPVETDIVKQLEDAGLASKEAELPVDQPPEPLPIPSPDEDFVPTLPTETKTPTGPGYYDEITGEFIPDENGGLQGPLGPETGNFDPDQKWEYSLTRPGVWTNDAGEEIDLSYMPDRDTAMTGKELMDRAGITSGGFKAGIKTPNATGTKPATGMPPATGTKPATGMPPATGTTTSKNPAVDAITNLANQQQQQQNSLLSMMMNDKNEGAKIKSYKELFGEGLFGDTYVPPSALGYQAGYSPQPQFQGQENDVEEFFRGGDVTDINTLLQILRG